MITFHKLNKNDSLLRIFIGTSPGGQDNEAETVLEHSLRRRTELPLCIQALCTVPDPNEPTGGWRTEQWVTPWTALRWAIPEICGFQGRAIYFDCPSLVLSDITELANAPIPGKAFVLLRRYGRTLSTACAVFDCQRAAKYLQPIAKMREDVGAHQSVGHLLERYPHAVAPLPNGWGATDGEFSRSPNDRWGSVHFVSPYMQPHMGRARSRLARAGRKHWFDGVLLPHYCASLVRMFEQEYMAAQAEQAAAE